MKRSLKEKEDAIFEVWKREWRRTLKRTRQIEKDGVVSEKEFNRGLPRIVFVLKETNGHPGDMRKFLANYHDRHLTWTAVSNMLEKLRDGNYSHLEPKLSVSLFRRIGLINLKKTPGGGTTDLGEFKEFLKEPTNRKCLKRQIRLYTGRPTIFACGGDVVFSEFCRLLQESFSEMTIRDNWCLFSNRCIAFRMWHPACRKSMEERVRLFVRRYRFCVRKLGV